MLRVMLQLREGLYVVLTVSVTIMTITGGGGGAICSVNSYCDNNGEVYLQC